MARRKGREGWIGIASPPFTNWNFTPSNKRLGGPNFIELPNGKWVAGSRDYDEKPVCTALWWLNPEDGQYQEFMNFPSAGDNSYPGFVVDESQGRLYVSYYSSHEGKTAIYLAVLDLETLMKSSADGQ